MYSWIIEDANIGINIVRYFKLVTLIKDNLISNSKYKSQTYFFHIFVQILVDKMMWYYVPVTKEFSIICTGPPILQEMIRSCV